MRMCMDAIVNIFTQVAVPWYFLPLFSRETGAAVTDKTAKMRARKSAIRSIVVNCCQLIEMKVMGVV